MKPTLCLAICLIVAPLFAADPVVIVRSPTEVFIDNVPFGKVADAIANNRQLAPAIQLALEKWDSERNAAIATASTAASEKDTRLTGVIARKLSKLRDEYTAAIATGDGPRAKALAAKIEAVEALDIEGKKPAMQARKEQLLREAAEKQAEAAKIQP